MEQEIIDKILKEYEDGLLQKEISTENGLSEGTVCRIIREYGDKEIHQKHNISIVERQIGRDKIRKTMDIIYNALYKKMSLRSIFISLKKSGIPENVIAINFRKYAKDNKIDLAKVLSVHDRKFLDTVYPEIKNKKDVDAKNEKEYKEEDANHFKGINVPIEELQYYRKQNLSYSAIGKIFGISARTVSARLNANSLDAKNANQNLSKKNTIKRIWNRSKHVPVSVIAEELGVDCKVLQQQLYEYDNYIFTKRFLISKNTSIEMFALKHKLTVEEAEKKVGPVLNKLVKTVPIVEYMKARKEGKRQADLLKKYFIIQREKEDRAER